MTDVSSYSSGLFALAGTVVGGLVSAGVNLFTAHRARRVDRKALAAAIAGEIDGFMRLMERRRHVERIETLATLNEQAAAAGSQFGTIPSNMITDYEQKRDVFPVLSVSVGKIGALGNICGDVAEFYNLVEGVRTTIIAAQEGSQANASPAQVADLMRSELAVWGHAMALGRNLVRELRKMI